MDKAKRKAEQPAGKQQQNAKKVKVKQTFKVYLNSPFAGEPSLTLPTDAVQEDIVTEIVKQLAPVTKILQARHMHRQTRKISAETCEQNEVQAAAYLKWITLGINAVTRALEADSAGFVCLNPYIKPAILTNHVKLLAVSKNVPILFLPNLGKRLCQCFAVKKLAVFAFSRCIPDEIQNQAQGLQNFVVERTPAFDMPCLRKDVSQLPAVEYLKANIKKLQTTSSAKPKK